MTNEILIVGSSVRAAAQSACRSGLKPLALDSFADVDLLATCPTMQVGDYPNGLISAAKQCPGCPWMYTGAMENHPRVIRSISHERTLLGNDAQTVRAVRDPWQLKSAFERRHIPYPEIRRTDETLSDGSWICKPLRSGGGFSIQRFSQSDRPTAAKRYFHASHYYQQFVAGKSVAAIFVSDGHNAALLGITQQRTRGRDFPGYEFVYAGSIGPLVPTRTQQRQLETIGRCLAEHFRLAGLFGVDLILCNDTLWVIEVNPRYTASVEILERACTLRSIELHVSGCVEEPVRELELPGKKELHGKAIVYAHRPLTIRSEFANWAASRNRQEAWPVIADIPVEGSTIRACHPICTVFASGGSVEGVERHLKSAAEFVREKGERTGK